MGLDFQKIEKVAATSARVIPVVVQEKQTGRVLTLAYMNELALNETLKSGFVTFWSTSRNELWYKGATSGNRLRVSEVWQNCEENSLLVTVELEGEGACHVKDEQGRAHHSCFFEKLSLESI